MHRVFVGSLAIVGTLGLFACGCGGPKTGDKVTGSVTMGGQPQAGATVSFIPSQPAEGIESKSAAVDAQGKFELKLLPGKYAVIISKMVTKGGQVPGPEEDYGMLEAEGKLRQAIPSKYTQPKATPLSAEIPAGGIDLPPFEVTK